MHFVTIATFSSYYDAVLPKSLLESEGIVCYLRDENSVVLNPVLTNSIGGIKLQVPDKDYTQAEAILIEAGYNVVTQDTELSPGWKWFDSITHNLPLLGKQNLLVRAVCFIIIISLILISVLYKTYKADDISSAPHNYDYVSPTS